MLEMRAALGIWAGYGIWEFRIQAVGLSYFLFENGNDYRSLFRRPKFQEIHVEMAAGPALDCAFRSRKVTIDSRFPFEISL